MEELGYNGIYGDLNWKWIHDLKQLHGVGHYFNYIFPY